MGSAVGAVVLAAGRSARMGGANKLLEPLGEEPLVKHVVRAAAGAGAAPVVVVTGHEAVRVAAALASTPSELVHNARWQEGMSTSVAAGVAALEGRVAAALICLGDMPRVSVDDLRALIRAFQAAPPGKSAAAYVPVYEGRRGNPVLWTAAWFPELRALAGDRGARALLERLGSGVAQVQAGEGVLMDADTPEAVEQLRSLPASEPSPAGERGGRG